MQKLVLIDGHSIMHRAFYGIPELTNSQGLHTNAVYGFLNILFKVIDEEQPDFLAVAFDVHAPTFRHEMYKEYKGTRKPMPDELREQIPVIKDTLKAMDILVVEKPGYEADDILGTLAKSAEKDGVEVSLVSGDRDLLQIASEHIKIRIPKTKMGKTEVEDYYAEDVVRTYQVTPKQFIELKALMGDTADNIPGVPKVGTKTATDLMVTYGSLENIYANLEQISKKSIRESLAENKALADLSLELATICIDAELPVTYKEARINNIFTEKAYSVFRTLEFKNFLTKFNQVEKPKIEVQYVLAESESAVVDYFNSAISNVTKEQTNKIAFLHIPEMCIALQISGSPVCFVSLWNKGCGETALNHIQKCIADGFQIIAFDLKNEYKYILKNDLHYEEHQFFDILIAAYVANPLKNNYQIEDIANEYLGLNLPLYVELFGKKEPSEVFLAEKEKYIAYICGLTDAVMRSEELLSDKLKDIGSWSLFTDIEMPLSFVLYHMEQEGILIKPDELKDYGDMLKVKILELESRIYEEAGVEFNINSPKQLGEILFGQMMLPGGKKTKTGYSTAADVLEKLAPQYPFVSDILEYRGLSKLKSTYADGLAAYIDDDNRIRTTFNQTITATGRLSSTEPNLQNIPMRMEMGRQIRRLFIPKDGFILMDADYSQIELRVLASMSGDKELIKAYQEDADIHRITASKVFGIPADEVTPLQRRNAKAVNFGIVYGISSFGLSQDLSITRKEAEGYIKAYFKTYPGIKTFLDNCVEEAKKNGYSITLFGRRRPIPELSSSNFMQRSFGERVAMNAPIQGTAADIIKIAMIEVDKALRENGFKSRLILQVHDELLLEVAKDEIEEVSAILTDKMQHAVNIAVNLEIDLGTGENWYDAH